MKKISLLLTAAVVSGLVAFGSVTVAKAASGENDPSSSQESAEDGTETSAEDSDTGEAGDGTENTGDPGDSTDTEAPADPDGSEEDPGESSGDPQTEDGTETADDTGSDSAESDVTENLSGQEEEPETADLDDAPEETGAEENGTEETDTEDETEQTEETDPDTETDTDTEGTAKTSKEKTETEKSAKSRTSGEEQEITGMKVTLKNTLSREIVSVQAKNSCDEQYSDNLLPEKKTIRAAKTVAFGIPDTVRTEDGAMYDLLLTDADGEKIEIPLLPLIDDVSGVIEEEEGCIVISISDERLVPDDVTMSDAELVEVLEESKASLAEALSDTAQGY